MRKRLVILIFLIAHLMTSVSGNSVLREFQITTDENDQALPAIFGNIVVWQDERNGNHDIYGYDLSTKTEFQITRDKGDQKYPAIYGNIVVWHDTRNGKRDIYGAYLDIDFTIFISQEAEFFFEMGKEKFEEKSYEIALDFFQLAKEKYVGIGFEEKVVECDEWIQKCQVELKKGFCVGTFLLLEFLFLGVFVQAKRHHKNIA